MKKTTLFAIAAVLAAAGCSTQTQHETAHAEWDNARASVLYSLATDQYQNGQFEKCQESLDQAIAMSPNDPGIHLLAAKVAIEQGKLEPAMAHAEQARKIDPKNAEADYLTGVIWQRWANPTKACDAYMAAAGKNPAELSYALAEAEMLVAMNRPAEALSLLQAKEIQFDHSGALRDEVGQLLVQQKEYSAAVVELRLASELSTDDPAVHEHLAFALLADKQYLQAGEAFDRLIKTDAGAKRADLWAGLGECQCNTDRLRDGRESLQTATELDPAAAGYQLQLARVCVQLDDLPRADVLVRRVISSSPGSAEAQCLLGYVRLKQGRLPESLAAFEAASVADPADTVSICMRGYVLAKMNRADESREAFTAALKIKPGDELATSLMRGVNRHD
jgi:tetratricopeptide (TPR) repeat protein